jgi:transcriptional regulator with XRE-family HTH domain
MTFSEKLQKIRKDRGWSQPKLAEETGIAVATIREWEQRRRNPSVPLIRKLADALECTVEDLLDD